MFLFFSYGYVERVDYFFLARDFIMVGYLF